MQFDWLSFAILLFLVAGFIFGALPVVLSYFVSSKSKAGDLTLPYECGVNPMGSARVNFGINYYFYALLFLAFEVDVLYLFPVAVVYSNSPGWTLFIALLIFLGILGLAVVYFWRKGVFTWPRRISF